ncbi:putative glycosyltransferase [Planomonospora parontospora subsp. parontospora]|uniref:Glycosyltransferase n=2 Tax=Planomonospora parontospora TaxID=58119 RepID=A0AA37F3E4_9ACTN|nr:glycosyltransferase [Planomonospora parontospora]GGK55834.1 putative glycosyltransferase [Planomonospora parontospora]GII07330.1 putative glycosyltransferase [Planomonospora parontospora subsp. parontospora]
MSTVLFACLDADTLGGIQRVTHTVAQGLAERGHDVHVVGLHRAEHPFRYVERPRYRRHVVHRTPPGRLSRTAARHERRRLAELTGRLAPGFAVLSSPSVVARLRSQLPRHLLPIGQYHGSYQHARGSWHLRSVRGHYGRLERAVFVSEDDAWLFSEHALLPNTWSIPNPLPAWPAGTAGLTARRVLGVGRLEGVKRFDRLISAFAMACGSGPAGWELHLIGEGAEEERLRAHARACGVADRVVFRGAVPAAEMGREYLGGSVLGLSSEHEGLPLVVAEAASYGVPSVAFDVSGGVRSLVRDGETGILVPPADVDAFAAALAGLMFPAGAAAQAGGPVAAGTAGPPYGAGATDGSGAAHRSGAADPVGERRRLGAAARAHAGAFRLERVLDRWEELFDHVIR